MKNEYLKICHNECMRRKGTDERLAERKISGLALLYQGKKPKKKKRNHLSEFPSNLSEKKVRRLEKALDKGAFAFGHLGNY